MPNHNDLCAWCNQQYQNHSASKLRCQVQFTGEVQRRGDRFSNTRTFAEYDTLILSQVPVGAQIEIWVTSSGALSKVVTGKYLSTTLVLSLSFQHPSFPLIGWGNDHPIWAWPSYQDFGQDDVEMKKMGLTHGWYALDDMGIHRVVSFSGVHAAAIVPASPGMSCALSDCKTFCPMAAPNQSDGQFICFSCRSAGRHRYMR